MITTQTTGQTTAMRDSEGAAISPRQLDSWNATAEHDSSSTRTFCSGSWFRITPRTENDRSVYFANHSVQQRALRLFCDKTTEGRYSVLFLHWVVCAVVLSWNSILHYVLIRRRVKCFHMGPLVGFGMELQMTCKQSPNKRGTNFILCITIHQSL